MGKIEHLVLSSSNWIFLVKNYNAAIFCNITHNYISLLLYLLVIPDIRKTTNHQVKDCWEISLLTLSEVTVKLRIYAKDLYRVTSIFWSAHTQETHTRNHFCVWRFSYLLFVSQEREMEWDKKNCSCSKMLFYYLTAIKTRDGFHN